MIKKNIFKSLVALMLLATIPACTDEVPVDVNTQGEVRTLSLGNIVPDGKPTYETDVESRAGDDILTWGENDELLLKVELSNYTTYLKLKCGSNAKWTKVDGQEFTSIKENETTVFKAGLSLVDIPEGGIVLSKLEILVPEELVSTSPSPSADLFYAPDLEWKSTTENEVITTVSLGLEESPSTTAPEYWELESGVWKTNLAKIRIHTNVTNSTLTLTACESFNPYEKAVDNTYTAPIIDNDAYFYASTTTDVKLDGTSGKEFKLKVGDGTEIPIASTINKLEFEAGKSYLLDISSIN